MIYGAPDEWMWRTELGRLNKEVDFPGLTEVFWAGLPGQGCAKLDNYIGSPCAFATQTQVEKACKDAHEKGYFFVRKFNDPKDAPDVISTLLGSQCIGAKMTDTGSTSLARVPLDEPSADDLGSYWRLRPAPPASASHKSSK